MRFVTDDQLIEGMAIRRTIAAARVQPAAARANLNVPRVRRRRLGDRSRRRWWTWRGGDDRPATGDASTSTPRRTDQADRSGSRSWARHEAHVRHRAVVPMLVLEGRAWDTGLDETLGARAQRAQ